MMRQFCLTACQWIDKPSQPNPHIHRQPYTTKEITTVPCIELGTESIIILLDIPILRHIGANTVMPRAMEIWLCDYHKTMVGDSVKSKSSR